MRYFLAIALLAPIAASAQEVNVETFVRAETDHMIRLNMESQGLEVGKIAHLREPTTVANQTVIRSNQDTLYSSVVLDLSEPLTFTLPEIGGRYMSMHVINQDHYMFVKTQPGAYDLTEETVGSRFAIVLIRTFVDVNDPDDVAKAHAAQDAIEIAGGGAGPFEAPDWNLDKLAVIRKALNDVAALGFDSTYAFGSMEETRPVDHLVGAAAGWGGLPVTAAYYLIDSVSANDGATPHAVTVKDVPVDAFWSITVYNSDGYLAATTLAATATTTSRRQLTRTAATRSISAAARMAAPTASRSRQTGATRSACTSRGPNFWTAAGPSPRSSPRADRPRGRANRGQTDRHLMAPPQIRSEAEPSCFRSATLVSTPPGAEKPPRPAAPSTRWHGAGTETSGPGPLVTQISKNSGTLPIPITIVPGELSKERLEAIT